MEEDLTFCQNDDQAFKNKTIWCPGVLFVSEIMRNLPQKTQIVSHSNRDPNCYQSTDHLNMTQYKS